MNPAAQIARHLREVHFGGNWTSSSLKEQLEGVNWQMAITPVYSFNTIAALVYHVNYFVGAVLQLLQGGALNAKDIYSFDVPPIQSEEEWQKLLDKSWSDAESLACLVEQLPESKLWEDFSDKKYGNYYRNLQGIIEHIHYHLGQIVLIKKVLLDTKML
jgi:hypothetical protein